VVLAVVVVAVVPSPKVQT
jgi:hypothetical protein